MNSKGEAEKSPVLSSASERLCLNLSRGLHAAAQPLAILRASVGRGQTDRLSLDELRELLANSAAEVERVCTLFSGLQQLVSIESVEPHLSPTPIVPLLAQVADGVDLLFKADGMTLGTELPETCLPAVIDGARSQLALSSVLLVAHGVSRASDTVELTATPCSGSVQVVVRNLNSQADTLSAEAQLGMAIAEASIRSQKGSFSWNLRPFDVQIQLLTAPMAHP
jgi:hypothetical protein